MRGKTFTHPFEHRDQQMTKATKRIRAKWMATDETQLVREEIREYLASNSNSQVSHVKFPQCGKA